MNQVYCAVTVVTGILFIFMTYPIVQSMENEDYDEHKMQQKIADSVKEHGLDPETAQIMMPPKVSDEDQGSRHMPGYLRCSGCVAVSHQFDVAYQKAMKSVKANGRLPLADQIEVAEIVCEKKMLGYGLKEARGKKLLSGPGLAGEQLPGVMEAGGKWEARLKTLCLELIEEFEEEGIYNVYTVFGSGGFSQGLCGSYCKGKDEINAVKFTDQAKTEL